MDSIGLQFNSIKQNIREENYIPTKHSIVESVLLVDRLYDTFFHYYSHSC
jgi:hypothetical protein